MRNLLFLVLLMGTFLCFAQPSQPDLFEADRISLKRDLIEGEIAQRYTRGMRFQALIFLNNSLVIDENTKTSLFYKYKIIKGNSIFSNDFQSIYTKNNTALFNNKLTSNLSLKQYNKSNTRKNSISLNEVSKDFKVKYSIYPGLSHYNFDYRTTTISREYDSTPLNKTPIYGVLVEIGGLKGDQITSRLTALAAEDFKFIRQNSLSEHHVHSIQVELAANKSHHKELKSIKREILKSGFDEIYSVKYHLITKDEHGKLVAFKTLLEKKPSKVGVRKSCSLLFKKLI